ncbi:unnamed protein product [Rotaria sp. Silwood1]|nr:unnamed protein product [Rotaria sp. Silwood1]
MKNILNEAAIGTTTIPAIAFCLFQLMFAATATTIVIGVVYERGHHADGVPIHISAGTSALAYSLVFGKRQTLTNAQQNKPHNINNLFIGTLLTCICVYFGRKVKKLFQIDDAFDIFAQHGIGGFTGCILTGIFAQKSIPELDLVSIRGGWLDGYWMQVIYQLAFASAGFVWSFVVTLIILLVMNNIPGLSLRTALKDEIEGINYDQFNEYTHDYIELQRDLNPRLYSKRSPANRLVIEKRTDLMHVTQQQHDTRLGKLKPISVITNAW